MSQADMMQIEINMLRRVNGELKAENDRLKARLTSYRRQADDAMADRRACARRDKKRERALFVLKAAVRLTAAAAGLAVTCAGLAKLGAWIAYIAG